MNYHEINSNAEETANAIWNAIGSKKPSIGQLIVWLENNLEIKIKIDSGKAEGFHEISGLSGLEYFDPAINAYRIWYRESDCEYRKRFTLVHEIAHILRNSPKEVYGFSDGNIYDDEEEERFCNRFSAAFLMPKEIFMEDWNADKNAPEIFKKAKMTKYFKVSGDAVHYRAKELGLI